MYDLIIIGGGPSGITAGIYASRKRIKTLIVSKDFQGQAGKAIFIENWPGIQEISGIELMKNFKDHLRKFEIETLEDEIVAVIEKKDNFFKIFTDKQKEFSSRSVIIASGKNPRPLKIKGEDKFIGRGVVYCSVCDGPLFANKKIAVIGGGNSGFQTALEMADKYSAKVYLFELSFKVSADECLQERVEKNENIELIKGVTLEEINGDKFVESIKYKDIKLQEIKEIEVQGVFVEIGSVPATDFLKDLVDYNEKGEIKINHKTCETKTNGLFVAGDVSDIRDKQIIISSGEGAKAALSAYFYLSKN